MKRMLLVALFLLGWHAMDWIAGVPTTTHSLIICCTLALALNGGKQND